MNDLIARFTIEMFDVGNDIRLRIWDNETGEVHEKSAETDSCVKALTVATKTLRKWCKEKES
jgi:hypothetical protein